MNIIIADGHTLCREALGSYLKHADQDLSISGVGDYAGLMEVLYAQKADMLLLDPHLPGLPMISDFSDISVPYPSLRVGLMFSGPEDGENLPGHAVMGMFPKSLSCKAFLQGIHQVLAGERFVPDDTVQLYERIEPAQVKSADQFHLTAREKQVMAFLVQGATNKDIARALDLQVVTVKLHVRGICRKIGAKNRTQAALIAKENGWN